MPGKYITFNLTIEWGLKHCCHSRTSAIFWFTSNLTIGCGLKLGGLCDQGSNVDLTSNHKLDEDWNHIFGALNDYLEFYSYIQI